MSLDVTVVALGAPYRGLAPFGETELDALLFFGRERETEIAVANLIASRLTILYGPSGVGKSSLLHAGVARCVRELGARDPLEPPDLACVVFSSWADDPVRGIADAVAAEVGPLVPDAPPPPAGASLADVLEHWSAALGGDLCLVLDQLEEAFVYHEDGGALVAELAAAITRPSLRCNVLLSLRDDALSQLDVFKARIPHVYANSLRLDRLDRRAARAAILGPVQRWNDSVAADERMSVEPELVDDVLDQSEAGGDEGRVEAPYLQLVMERLWNEERERGSAVLRRSTLAELGGAEAIVREHLDRALAGLDPEEQDAAARMFEHLVTPSGTKIAHRGADLAQFARLPADGAEPVLAALGRERILRPLDEDDRAGRYEIFHDVLASAILDWRRRRELEKERDAARRRQRRLLGVAAGSLAALVIVAGVAVYALGERANARAQARHSEARALAAGALAAINDDPELSMALAADAARTERTPQVEGVLRDALLQSRGRAVLGGHDGPVLAVGFSGRAAVTVDHGGTVRLFENRRLVSKSAFGHPVGHAAIDPGGTIVVGSRRRLVEVRRLPTAAGIFAFREPARVRAVAVSVGGARVASATQDGGVRVRARTGRVVFAVRVPFVPNDIALDLSGRTLAVVGGQDAIVWRIGRRRPVARIRDRTDLPGVALSPDGSLVATAGSDSGARVWRVPGGELMNVLVGHKNPLVDVAFSRDGGALATLSRDGTGRTGDVQTGRAIAVLAGHGGPVLAAAFSPSGRSLVTGSADGAARVWDPGIAPDLRVVSRPRSCCAALVAAGDGAVAAAGRSAILYRGRVVVTRFDGGGGSVTALAAAGGTLVTGTARGVVRVWRIGDPARPLRELRGRAPVTAVALTTDGSRVAAARGTSVDTSSTMIRERAAVNGLAFSPAGRVLATAGGDGVVRLRDVRTGRLLHELRGHTDAVTAVAFSPDGRLLASSSRDFDVGLWDPGTGRSLRFLKAHFAMVSGVGFSPDGRWIVTAGPTTVGLWRTGSLRFLTYLRGPSARVVGAAFARDGRTIYSASKDGTVRTYRCDVCGPVDELRAVALRRLTQTGRRVAPADRARYAG